MPPVFVYKPVSVPCVAFLSLVLTSDNSYGEKAFEAFCMCNGKRKREKQGGESHERAGNLR